MPASEQRAAPGVLLISSYVARGAVGLRAGVFACERLGLRVWSVPTVTLAYHPGHGPSARSATDPALFKQLLEDLIGSKWVDELGVVVSGYLGSPEQAALIADAVVRLKDARPGCRYVCDPVIGDTRGLYVPEETAAAIRDRLLPLADVATPNLAELSWLTGSAPATNAEIEAAAASMGPGAATITSVPALMRGSVGVQVVANGRSELLEHHAQRHAPNGTGDLFTALVAARLAHGQPLVEAATLAAASVSDVVIGSVRSGADELMIPELQGALLRPQSRVQTRKLMHAAK